MGQSMSPRYTHNNGIFGCGWNARVVKMIPLIVIFVFGKCCVCNIKQTKYVDLYSASSWSTTSNALPFPVSRRWSPQANPTARHQQRGATISATDHIGQNHIGHSKTISATKNHIGHTENQYRPQRYRPQNIRRVYLATSWRYVSVSCSPSTVKMNVRFF